MRIGPAPSGDERLRRAKKNMTFNLLISFEKSIISHDADMTSSHADAIAAVASAAICFNNIWIFSDVASIVFISFSTSHPAACTQAPNFISGKACRHAHQA